MAALSVDPWYPTRGMEAKVGRRVRIVTKFSRSAEDRRESFPCIFRGKEGMELYNELASNEEATRIKAAEELLKKILDAKKNGNAEKGVEVNYALTRLVKGLSSGRESARIGFSTALTEVLHLTEDLTTAFA
jgi:hypothetical protein